MSKESINNTIRLLNLYKESGVDEAIGNIINNRTKIIAKNMKKINKREVEAMINTIQPENDNIDKISTLDQLKKTMFPE